MSSDKRAIQISKALAYLLRHGAVKEKLPISATGYVPIDTILQHQRLKSFKTTKQDVLDIVANNDKKRFHIENDCICAVQGHSISEITTDNLVPVTEAPATIMHGTNMAALEKILQSGHLSKMGRQHIHCCGGLDAVSGIRKSSTVYIYLKFEPVIGHIFRSKNDVLLIDCDVPVSQWERVEFDGRKKPHKVGAELEQLLGNVPWSILE